MSEKRTERRLAAVMSADVVGYSRMMGSDEGGTLEVLKRMRVAIFAPRLLEYRGRLVKLMGDGALVEFSSIVDAVACGVAVQKALEADPVISPSGDPIQLRIGVNLGDLIVEGRDIYGDGVNIAARLQEFADAGGVAISRSAHEHTGAKVDVEFVDAGCHELKNIEIPVQVFHWPPRPAGPGMSPALPHKPSIVVLPFDNMSNDTDQDYFADGVVESLTAALCRIQSLFVIARNTAFTYKGRHLNIQDIGRELGVAYVLEGSVQRAGGRVRITVQLIETTGGGHLWAEKYDGALDDIFELQDQITEQVAGALQPSIQIAEIERARRKRPQDMGAYDYTMRAMRHVWMLDKDEARTAIGLLEKALELDTEYPLALALLGWCWAQHSVYQWTDDLETTMLKAIGYAKKATYLSSSSDPLILTVLGTVHTIARDHISARGQLERSVKLDPNSAWGLSRLGWLEAYSGNPERARAHFERSMRLSPFDPMNFNNLYGMGSAYQIAGDDATAVRIFEQALRERPNAHWIHRSLAPALLGAGRLEEAQASCAKFLAAYPEATIAKVLEAMLFERPIMELITAQLRELGVPNGD
jgi:adenylate cyclase